MIFDKFCKIVEKFIPGMEKIAVESNVLFLIKMPTKLLKKGKHSELLQFKDIFALPFKITAIEDPASLIILIDTEDNQIGYSGKRIFIEFTPWSSTSESFADADESKKNISYKCRKSTRSKSQ